MISFGQSAFAVNGSQNSLSTQAVNRARAHQFQVFQDSPELITSPAANSTRLTSKRPLTDIIDTANQPVQKRPRGRPRKDANKATQTVAPPAPRVKKVPGRRPGQRNANRAPGVNSTPAPYNPTPPAAVNLQSRQAKRQSARLASRVPPSSQPLPQEEDDDHDFDDLPPIRPYAGLAGHESDQESGHASDTENDEEEESRLLNRRGRRAYAREIVRQRVRVRRSGPRNRRDGRSLGPDYMAARKKGVISAKYELPKLQKDDNVCSFCGAYQYDEECHSKLFDDKY